MTLEGLYVPVVVALAVAVLILVALYASALKENGSYRIALNSAFNTIREMKSEETFKFVSASLPEQVEIKSRVIPPVTIDPPMPAGATEPKRLSIRERALKKSLNPPPSGPRPPAPNSQATPCKLEATETLKAGRVRIKGNLATPIRAPKTGFKPSKGGSAVVRPSNKPKASRARAKG